jgi:hypothetical protein
MIYSPEYTDTGEFLVFKAGGPKGTCNTSNAMWNVSYHGNHHFKCIPSPKNPPCPSQDKWDMDHYQAYMQNALDNYQLDFAKLAFLSYTNGTPIPPHNIKPIWATTGLIMLYIAAHLLAASGAPISELQMKILLNQAEKCAIEFVQAKSVQPSLKSAQAPDFVSPMQSAVAHYTAELHATINKHCDSVLQLLELSATIKTLMDLSTRYNKLQGTFYTIISGLAILITHWVGRKYQSKNLRFLPIKPKMMLLNYMPHSCPLKCPPLLTLSPPGMLLLLKSHRIPFFPLVNLSHP